MKKSKFILIVSLISILVYTKFKDDEYYCKFSFLDMDVISNTANYKIERVRIINDQSKLDTIFLNTEAGLVSKNLKEFFANKEIQDRKWFIIFNLINSDGKKVPSIVEFYNNKEGRRVSKKLYKIKI